MPAHRISYHATSKPDLPHKVDVYLAAFAVYGDPSVPSPIDLAHEWLRTDPKTAGLYRSDFNTGYSKEDPEHEGRFLYLGEFAFSDPLTALMFDSQYG